jgi:GDP-L-fucose synthase
MKVLVLGSGGMVGSSVVNILNNSAYVQKVIPSTRKDTNLFSLSSTKKLIEDVQPDVVVNAAAKVGGIVYNNTKRTDFILENLKINMNLLEASITHKNMMIINLGSSCIYPLNAKNPIKEESFMSGKLEPTNSPYAMAKLSAIEIGRSLKEEYGHKIINLMPTNLYGPNDFFHPKLGHVIPSLMFRMHQAKLAGDSEIKIWGTGKPLREFLHVEDLALAIEHLFLIETNLDLLNVGSGEEVSIQFLGNLLKEVVGFKGNITFDTSMPDGNPRKLLDSSLINSIGWQSSIDLRTGITNTYKWFLENSKDLRL